VGYLCCFWAYGVHIVGFMISFHFCLVPCSFVCPCCHLLTSDAWKPAKPCCHRSSSQTETTAALGGGGGVARVNRLKFRSTNTTKIHKTHFSKPFYTFPERLFQAARIILTFFIPFSLLSRNPRFSWLPVLPAQAQPSKSSNVPRVQLTQLGSLQQTPTTTLLHFTRPAPPKTTASPARNS
jgi:hypothetical protein